LEQDFQTKILMKELELQIQNLMEQEREHQISHHWWELELDFQTILHSIQPVHQIQLKSTAQMHLILM
jgi:hypothetical protein